MAFFRPQLLAVGAQAPDFTLADEEGNGAKLADLRGIADSIAGVTRRVWWTRTKLYHA